MSKKPCKECPFNKKANLGIEDLGGSEPFVYIGQARGPFWLPCHLDKEYKDKNSDPAVVSQCRGAAIFRSNCNVEVPEKLLKLPEDREMVFESFEEFLAHYYKIPIGFAKVLLQKHPPEKLMSVEMMKAQVRFIDKTKM